MDDDSTSVPDRTAVWVAQWRASHVQLDPPPHVFSDEIGRSLVTSSPSPTAPGPGLDDNTMSRVRATMVGRARFIEDLLVEQVGLGVGQYVILGAGLDTFAQRRPDIASAIRVYEVDRPGPQAWKRRRLIELGYDIPEWLRFVPVDFEAGRSWWQQLRAEGFDTGQPAVVASAGVSLYLSRQANETTLRQVAALAPGTTLAMTFTLPLAFVEPEERASRQAGERFARASGSPFVGFFTPPEIVALALDAGFGHAEHVSADTLRRRYFDGRTDGLRPSSTEDFLVATVR